MSQQTDFYELWQRSQTDVKNLTDEIGMHKSDCHDLRRMLADVREQLAAKDSQLKVAIGALKEISKETFNGQLDKEFPTVGSRIAKKALKQMGINE